MATIKSFTSLEQSKKLAEILPPESADMYYPYDLDSRKVLSIPIVKDDHCMPCIHCWSLAALLDVIRETIGYTLYGVNNVYMSCDLGDKPWKLETEVNYNEVDACYKMILKLHELKLL